MTEPNGLKKDMPSLKLTEDQSDGQGQIRWNGNYGKLGPTFEYAGDGSFKIDNLKPDFVSKNRRVVVEVYGDYWHKDEPLHKTMRRVSRFERRGWRVVIIWESEINDPIKLRRKLALI